MVWRDSDPNIKICKNLPRYKLFCFVQEKTMRDQSSTVSRRSLFGGAATVGAVAAAASVLPTVVKNQLPASAPAMPKPERGGGYSLSEHVQQYYKTTRI
jgi:hypothetical protein